jgi:hypothetical protein
MNEQAPRRLLIFFCCEFAWTKWGVRNAFVWDLGI